MNTIEVLNDIFRQVFGDNSLNITQQTSADDVEDWDSLTHMILITTIEAKFKIRFTQQEILDQSNVGDLINDIDRHLVA